MDVAHAHRRGVHVRAFLRADGALGESVPADDAVFCELHSRRTVAAPVHRGLSLTVSGGHGNSIRNLGAWRCTRSAWRMGSLLHGIHGRVPADARRAHDVALSRRGAGPGEPGNDGAAAGARVARQLEAIQITVSVRSRRVPDSGANATAPLVSLLVTPRGDRGGIW